jgi:hypothetical protein
MLESHTRKAAHRREHGMSKQSLVRLAGGADGPVLQNLHADLARHTEEKKNQTA